MSPVPSGWTGYFVLFEGDAGTAPSCPAAFPTTGSLGNEQLDAPAASCSCQCGAPSGQTCSVGALTVQDALCGVPPACAATLATGSGCFAPDGLAGGLTTCGANGGPNCQSGTSPCNQSISLPAATVTGGACAASSGSGSISSPTWKLVAQACGGASALPGCANGEVCAPRPETPFQPGLCIMQSGDQTCPSGPFSSKHVSYGNLTDSRACSTCGCGAPQGATCTAQAQVFNSAMCSNIAVTVTAGSCTNLSGNPTLVGRKVTLGAPSGGACAATGGQPQGTATPTQPTTFCCQP